MTWPSILSTFSDPQPTDRLSSPSHSGVEIAQNQALRDLQAGLGTDSSVLGTVIGDLRNPSSGGGGHVQTANKGGTGQTSYTKGDILAAASSSVLSKVAAGADGTFLRYDSTKTTGIGNANAAIIDYQVFTSTGVWTKPSVLSGSEMVFIQMWGGGGSGGGTAAASTPQAGGGGGGAYVEGMFRASVLGTTVAVNVAASVLGGSNVDGTNGNTSQFGSVLSAFGGGGGAVRTTNGNSGGAGGGGWMSAGAGQGSGTGGAPGGATGSASVLSAQGGGAGGPAATTGTIGFYGGGGGGGGGAPGANSYFGGGGGGGGGNSGVAGGSSLSGQGGAGGTGGASGNGGAGTAPGGGGGGSQSNGSAQVGGTGARGEVRVTVI